MTQNLINFRAADGIGAHPNETPFLTALQSSTRRFFTGDVVPMPNVTGPTVLVPDVSKWNLISDYSIMANRGIKAVWVKVNQGKWIDSEFETHLRGFLDVGIEVGGYDFLDPAQCTAAESAQTHYNLTHNTGMKLSSWMDGERHGGLTPDGLLNYYIEWYETLAGLLNDERKTEVYTRKSFWNTAVRRSDYWMNTGLNAARYHLGLSTPWSDGYYPPLDWPYGLNEYHLWQYSADGNGMGPYFGAQSASIDLNLYNGDWQSFVDYYGLESDPVTDPCPCQDQINVLTARVMALEERVDDLEDGVIDPPPEPPGYDIEMVVKANPDLRLRDAPIDGDTIAALPYNATVWISREGQVSVTGGNWVKTKYNGLEGWSADWWLADPPK